MLKSKIKPGDLIKGMYKTGRNDEILTGIIIKESDRTNHWADKIYVWWWILTSEGDIIEDVEGCFEKICE
jgi:hypothetical protein